MYDGIVGADNVNPREELQRLDEQIDSAGDLAALKPIFYRLNEIIKAYPGDFDIQFTGDAVKQRLMARGKALKEQETSPPPPLAPPPAASAPPPMDVPEPPLMPAATPFEQSLPLFDSPAPEPPPPALPETLAMEPAPVPPRPAFNWKYAVVLGALASLLVPVIFFTVGRSRKPKVSAAPAAAVPVAITTNPPGAAVTLTPSGRGKPAACTSNCKLALVPGAYQLSALLDGFDPALVAVTASAGRPVAVNINLQTQAQSLRVLTDLEKGKVTVDDHPALDLIDGQLVLDKVPPGAHAVKLTAPNGDASFAFEVAPARLPTMSGPVKSRNMIAVLVASFAKQARVVTSQGPWKLAVNGQPQGDAGPAGTDLTSFHPGVNEFVLGEGKDQRNVVESFGAAPMLTAFLKSDINAGTLIVSTGQDDARVFLNDKPYPRRTQRGQLRIQTLGKVTVRVAKSGFQDAPPQTVEVKKGAELRLQFDLKPQPQFGSLQVQGAAAGTEVLVDQKIAGTVGTDAPLSISGIQPGDHTIELRRERYQPKRLQRSFQAGQSIVLVGADVVLAPATGTVQFTRNPASATVTWRRGEESEGHEIPASQIELPPGNYTFAAAAPGFAGASIKVQLAAGDNRVVEFTLAREKPATPPPATAKGMTEFEDSQGWKQQGDNWTHKGGGFVPYKLSPKGVFTFTAELLKGGGVFRSGQIRWCVQYLDSKNYVLSEIDPKTFWSGVVEKGKRLERVKAPHNLGNQKSFTIQVEVTPDLLVQRVRIGNEWKVLDTFTEPGRDFTQGKFGFLIQGNDEIAISDFKFQPK